MMKKFFIVAILILSAFSSCKDESGKTNTQEPQTIEIEEKKELIVQLNFKTNQEDEFRLMLNNIEVDALQKKNIIIRETVAPSSGPETITANFGENISNNLVFNLGNNKVKEVDITSIELSYGKTSISINTPDDFYKYFVTNKFLIPDSTSTKLKSQRVDGNHFPAFSSRRRLINALKN